MNIGSCPYEDCDGSFMLEVPDQTPAYALIQCDDCGRDVWYRFSRIDPEAWTREGFEAEHTINYETRQIERRATTTSDAGEQRGGSDADRG